MKPCPYCGESIQDVAAKCRFCGEWLDPSKRPAWSESGPSPRAAPAFTPTPLADEAAPAPVAATSTEAPPPPPDYAGSADAVPTAVSSALGEAPSWVRTGAFPSSSPTSAAAATAAAAAAAPTPWTPPSSSPRPPPPNGSLQGLLQAPARAGTAIGLPPLAPLHPSISASARADEAPASRPPPHDMAATSPATSPATRPPPPPGDPLLDDLPLTILEPSRSDLTDLGDLAGLGAPTREPSERRPAPPAPREKSGATDFEKAFFGGGDAFADEYESDSLADGDPFGSHVAPAPRPLPYRQALAGIGLLALVIVLGFRDRIFGGDAAATDEGGAIAPVATFTARAGEIREEAATKAEEARQAEAARKAEEARKAAEAAPPPVDPEFEGKLADARKAYEKHKLKAAQAGLDELARTQPNHPEVLLLTAQIQLERGDLTGSMQSSRRCVEVAPKQADCWLTLGVLEQNNKADEAAIKAYETYLELAPEGRYARDATTQLGRLKK